VKTKLSTTKREDLIAKLIRWHTEAEDGNNSAFQRMSQCERMKVGKQWDSDDLDWNKAHRKHSVTINRILPAVLHLDGHEIQNPRDVSVKCTKTSTATRARILSALVKNVLDESKAQRVKSSCFDDGLTTGRGYLTAVRDYERDPKGDWKLQTADPFRVLPDPRRTQYDPNHRLGGCRFVIEEDWCPKEWLEKLYPRMKEELGNASYSGDSDSAGLFRRFQGLISHMFGQDRPWEISDSYRQETWGDTRVQSHRYQDAYRRSTYWWRTWETGSYVQRLDQPDWFVTLHKKGDIEYAKDRLKETRKKNIRIIESTNDKDPVVVPVLHWAQMVGNVLLDYQEDPFNGLMMFPVFPFNPYFCHGYEYGIVENLIGPQKVVNSSWSRMLDLIKHLANTGWKVRNASDVMKRWLETHGSEDGIILNEKDFGGQIEKLEANMPNTGFAEISAASSQHINEIANVRIEDPNWDDKNMSGRAIALKQQGTMTGSAMLFTNYDHTNEIMGEFFVNAFIRAGDTDQAEIESIIDEEELIDEQLLAKSRAMLMDKAFGGAIAPPEPPDPVMVQRLDPQSQMRWWAAYKQEEKLYEQVMGEIDSLAVPLAKATLLDEFDNLPKGRYGVKVGLSEAAMTHRAQNFLETIELHKTLLESQYPGVPRDVLVKASDAPNKDEILEAAPTPTG